jgi:predicted kinase
MSGWCVPLPTLVVVSGPPGAGKTTLAHAVAAAVGCPAICRDEIKEGMVHATPSYNANLSQDLNVRTLPTFFDTLRLLLSAGVTVVAEAAFQDRVWRPHLEPLLGLAKIRIVRCTVSPEVARGRIARRLDERPNRAAHDDREKLRTSTTSEPGTFGWITLPLPTLRVATSSGYDPQLADIVAFIDAPSEPADETPASAQDASGG